MGSAVSTQRLRPLKVNWAVAIWRRLQQWRELKPVILSWMDFLGLRGRETIQISRTPEPGIDPPTAADHNTIVDIINIFIERALPLKWIKAVERQYQPPTSLHQNQVKRQDNREHPLSDEHPPNKEVLESNEHLVQSVQSLIERVAPGLDKLDEPKPEENAPKEVRDAYVSQYIKSSLNVALPSFDRCTPDASLVFPALSYENRDITHAAVGKRADVKLRDLGQQGLLWPHLDPSSIRLAEILPGSSDEIHVELSKKTLDEIKNEYEALSYVWGLPTPANVIQVNGVSVQVNPNLIDALLALRLPDTRRGIWIDAICVNQTDTTERSIELQTMGEIYRLAKTVVVFLGSPPSPSSSSITDLFKFLNRSGNGTAPDERNDRRVDTEAVFQRCGVDSYSVCKGFVELCLRPWWGRIWVMQEFYLASEEPVWYWGSEHTGNASLKRNIKLLMAASDIWRGDTSSSFHSDIREMIGKPMQLFEAEVQKISDMIFRRAATHGYDIPSRLYRELSARSTDPRDMVYGLREIFDTVFREFEGWGDLLWWYPFHHTGEEHLPSWLPDFTRRVALAASDFQPLDYPMSRNQPRLVVLNHALHAKGYRLDTIDGHIHIAKGDGYKALLVLWPNVVYYMPCWDILTRHAFSVGQGSSELQDDEATQGLLEGIFSPRMDGVFRNALDVDFIGACMFDWTNLAFVLDRLANASAWSEPNSPHWQYIPEISITDNRMEHARILIRNVRSFLTNIRQAVGCSAWGGLLYYSGLCNAILLDCVKHSDFKRVVAALKAAATELNYITFDYWTHAEVAESEAARIRSYHALTAKFQGRCLFWTKKGFHGLSSPGVEGCGNAVVLLDGLSFPMVIRDVEGDDSGRARLVGCALIRGVDMRKSRDTGSAKLPAGFSLEEKTVFKFV
ncbi:heterokaryon incompatibility protein-domain-containing protein [Dactylonectria estremocensis]|uniref:Heterokaryon incompatibility protein-domain-containing protein n=1 Tax=Dactylonectria estremocensis TaxID=1079267 RepID=A0A9P9D9W1_9HYPO|nr:heterokaryon incompatibility protein-domain-containing protein [Dactylonectria estremocensis]